MNLTDTRDIVTIATGAVGLFTAIGAGLTWLNIRGRRMLREQLANLQKELLPNGGKSLNDSIRRIEGKIDKVYAGFHFGITLRDEAVWECDPEGHCRWASPSLCHMFGIAQQDMIGFGWLEAVATQDERARVGKEWVDAVEKRIPYSAQYTIHNRMTGEKCVVESRGWPCVDTDGNPIWYYGTCERKHRFATRETEVHTAIAGAEKGELWQTRP
jgi:PAS domain S-box-containing protein